MVVRIEKVLESANIKLTSVASHVLSMSSRAMLDELIAGNQDTEAMAELARSNMRSKRAQLQEALVGNFGPHQKFMLESHLRLIDQLDHEIETLNQQIEERNAPFSGSDRPPRRDSRYWATRRRADPR